MANRTLWRKYTSSIEMTDLNTSFVATRLANRVAKATADKEPVAFNDIPVSEKLLDYLRQHLDGGETHYTARPGIPELRATIGAEIGRLGSKKRDPDGVIVTHGEGEALYVTLLGLGLSSESKLAVHGPCRHSTLLDLLGITTIDSTDTDSANADAFYREKVAEDASAAGTKQNVGPDIVSLDSLLFSAESNAASLRDIANSTILIGSLDSVPGLDHFRLGFVAGPPEIVKRIQTWKQALSICTAGPSQRAALSAIEGRSAS
jgi:aspartate/methionine/tyrosine aminotransferase